ncbi:long-chain fatty acid--CoA ligase [Bradyrhizobium arachidis]|uniref:long-chain-fatty-acid--CoA ligase n=1 Tax=Bradyrhizobium arachidis TaxID=858423 RepID=UPI0021624E9D|nr:long-chain fatty acid--CoA ligase [Bradyrhizobium arachidis]UVO31377.1 long-chain fatty acid--CoA ligase [Bradyrhizobium arachidis]
MPDYPWIKSYPDGIRWDASIAATPVQHILDEAVARWPDRPAISFMDRQLTYRELGDLVARAATGLEHIGVRPGMHVGLYLPNTPHMVIAFFAVLKVGAIVVNYSPLDAEQVVAHKVEDSETDFIITLDLRSLYPQMERLLHRTRLKALVIGSLAEMSRAPALVRADMKQAKQVVPFKEDDRHISFATLIANDGKHAHHEIGDPTKSIAVLQYTGGTTGLPKGAMLTHANLTVACQQYLMPTQGAARLFTEGHERTLIVLPLFHIYALTGNMLFCLSIGCELILHLRFDLEPVLKEIAAKRVTIFMGVPTMFQAMLTQAGAPAPDLGSIKYCASGGAPLPVELITAFRERYGCLLSEGWGMTETSPAGTFNPVGRVPKPGSCGIPLPGIELRIIDPDAPDTTVPLGSRGELCISGPNVMLGYWKSETATAEAYTKDGFFRTGDIAYMDEDGYVFIVDRLKDMLLCGGYNVYPRNIEEAIYQHPAIKEVWVIGIPDPYRGQSPKAFVALKPDASPISLDEMKAFLKPLLGKHEMISELEVREMLPKTPVGKLSKKELADDEFRKRQVAPPN